MRGTSLLANPVDIRPDHLEIVQGILREYLPEGVKVWVFGSRANWTTKDSSDLDLALESKTMLSHKVLGALKDAFEGSSLPYTVDVVDLNRIGDSFRQIVELQRVLLPLGGDHDRGEPVTAQMMSKLDQMAKTDHWRQVTLGEVIELKRGYDLPQQDRATGSVPIVSSSGIMAYHAEAKVKGPGVVTGRYGTVGQVFFVPGDFWPLNTALYVRDFKGNDPRFISYLLRCLDFSVYSDKAAVPGVNRNDLHQAQVQIPPLTEQRAIAHILGTLDDKIELNRRMNETLEEMARALFKSWFVDFDPVRAKMEGRWRPGESLPASPPISTTFPPIA